MGLRDLAARDFQRFANSQAGGFGYPLTITGPGQPTQELVGFSTDIGQTIDPDTGQIVAGRTASVSVARRDLDGLTIPENVHSTSGKPWVVVFDDIDGQSHTFKVRETIPDRAIGSIVLILEVYSP